VIAFEIDPTERTIRSVDLPAIPDGYDDDPKYLNDDGDVVYTERKSEATRGFILDGVRAPLVGVAYVVGTNEAGDDVAPKASYDSLVNGIDFGDCRDGMFYGERHVRTIQ
jgi:hypothetical protein